MHGIRSVTPCPLQLAIVRIFFHACPPPPSIPLGSADGECKELSASASLASNDWLSEHAGEATAHGWDQRCAAMTEGIASVHWEVQASWSGTARPDHVVE